MMLLLMMMMKPIGLLLLLLVPLGCPQSFASATSFSPSSSSLAATSPFQVLGDWLDRNEESDLKGAGARNIERALKVRRKKIHAPHTDTKREIYVYRNIQTYTLTLFVSVFWCIYICRWWLPPSRPSRQWMEQRTVFMPTAMSVRPSRPGAASNTVARPKPRRRRVSRPSVRQSFWKRPSTVRSWPSSQQTG